MGEVYKARDTRLDRTVAVKVSRDNFSDRFEREARSIAALNHPNVCHLYDVGPNYLVMELVEGPTLAARIREGPIPLPEALPIARQIADALDCAHEKGIVHRDFKPGNVMLTPDGIVKVLDFGLAKSGGFGLPASQDSPTVTVNLATEPGVILGTAAYMSPEQAKGKPVDRRADVWAFGVVLYEMVTGTRLFQGETATEVLAGVLKQDPDWNLVPYPVERLLRKCLVRDPQQRLRHIGDVMALVDEPAASPVELSGKKGSWHWQAMTAVLAIAVATFGYFYFRHGDAPAPEAISRFQIPAPENSTFFSLSPDGRRLAYSVAEAGRISLAIRTMDSLEAHPLPGTEEGVFTFWSPDSRFLGFSTQRKLKKIDRAGGPAQIICDVPAPFRGASWNQQGEILFGAQGHPLYKVPASGGTPVQVTKLDASRSETAHMFPSFLPDGRHFVYSSVSAVSANIGLFTGTLDLKPEEQRPRQLAGTASSSIFIPGVGAMKPQLLFLRDGGIVSQDLDTSSLVMAGDPVPIAERVGANPIGAGGFSYGAFAASSNGILVYRNGANGSENISQLTWFGRDGKVLGTAGDPQQYQTMQLSWDQTRAAAVRANDVWITDLIRGTSTRLTTEGEIVESAAVWSPDGTHVAFTANLRGVRGLYQKAADGSGTEELLWKGDNALGPSDWSADGNYVLFSVNDPKTTFDIWKVSTKGSHKASPVIQTKFRELAARFSRDGRWIAYYSDRSGRNEVYVQPFQADDSSAPASEYLISKDGALGMPRWREDGKEIYYLAPGGKVMGVEVSVTTSFRAAEPKLLFQAPARFVRGATPGALADAAADGKRFLFAAPIVRDDTKEPFIAVLNWTALLRK
jgi:serine/threonine protein kinase